MRKILLSAALVAGLAGCAGTGQDQAYDQLHAQAEKQIAVTNQMGFLWLDTDKLMQESGQAKDKGDMAKATKLAKEALAQAQLGQQQAEADADAEPYYPPHEAVIR